MSLASTRKMPLTGWMREFSGCVPSGSSSESRTEYLFRLYACLEFVFMTNSELEKGAGLGVESATEGPVCRTSDAGRSPTARVGMIFPGALPHFLA